MKNLRPASPAKASVPPLRMHNAKGLQRRAVAWLGIWLVVFAALFPLVSQAGSRFFGTLDWVELCTTYGTERIVLDQDGNPVEPDDKTNARCIVCTGTSQSLLPAAIMPAPLRALAPDLLITQRYVYPDVADDRHLAVHARAPPLVTG